MEESCGTCLRRTRRDKLPQFCNVLRVDMALIGPRPLLPAHLPMDEPKLLALRAAVRPGLTDRALINGGQAQRLALDLHHIRKASPLMGLRIVPRTLRMIAMGETVNHEEIERAEALLAAG